MKLDERSCVLLTDVWGKKTRRDFLPLVNIISYSVHPIIFPTCRMFVLPCYLRPSCLLFLSHGVHGFLVIAHGTSSSPVPSTCCQEVEVAHVIVCQV